MIAITMSKEQFECMEKYAESLDGVKLTISEESPLKGHIHTKYVDADFEYIITANTLRLDNEKKHGLYGWISDQTIGSHLYDTLGNIVCPLEEPASTAPDPDAGNTGTNTPLPANENPPEIAAATNKVAFVKPTIKT